MSRENDKWLRKYLKGGGTVRSDTAAAAGDPGRSADAKRGRSHALGRTSPTQKSMVDVNRKVLVRIRRPRLCGPQPDDDNLSGGCKQLRDAIAKALGFPGDSKADGIRFEYVQDDGDRSVE